MSSCRLELLAAIALALAGCASATKATGANQGGGTGLGLVKTAPIEVCNARGEQDYLARLRCGDGSKPDVGRRSNVGTRDPKLEPGERDPHLVDAFPVGCGATKLTVYLDMYHCSAAAPREAPEGLLFSPEP